MEELNLIIKIKNIRELILLIKFFLTYYIYIYRNQDPMKLKNLKKKYTTVLHEIKEFGKSLNTLTNSEIKIANFNLQIQYFQTQILDNLISRSFALTREASLRTLGLRHYDVQLLGGLVLNNNQIAEMRTGEGKTLVATLPASLHGITEKGVHIVTVNDYLTTRDYFTMNKVYDLLGLKAGLIQNEMASKERYKNYACNITYVTNSELAFDFLRDNTAFKFSDIVFSLPFNYCLIDEVDSVLIDEAQTPVILANNQPFGSGKEYIIASEITNYLELGKHYRIDEKKKNITLTEEGHKQIEKILDIPDLYDKTKPWITYIINALMANSLFFNNVHYIIQKNRIIIVDEFSGRTMPDRRWGKGLHQAIEAKEKLPISKPTRTQASTTYQNYFGIYKKLSGMTGTGKTAEIEFQNIYKLSVEVIPTFRQNKRFDLPDLIYKDQFSKWNAIAKFCKKLNKKGQPILVGTTSIGKSEMLSQLLDAYNLPHQLLNAKSENVKKESTIIAKAGIPKTITISTNMAGRGTDILLGGNITFQTQKTIYNVLTSITASLVLSINPRKILVYRTIRKVRGNSQKMLSILKTIEKDLTFLNLSYLQILQILQIENLDLTIQISIKEMINLIYQKLMIYNKKNQLQQNQIVKNLGGLYVIGTERNDSRRIDNQLRGRCGRQGDPGSSRFFVSLEDTLLRLFGDKRIQISFKELLSDSPLQSKFISEKLDLAQEQVEERAFEKRKNLFKYDKILTFYSRILYLDRLTFLINSSSTNFSSKTNFSYAEQNISEFLELFFNLLINSEDFNDVIEKLFNYKERTLYKKLKLFEILEFVNKKELQSYLYSEYWLIYNLKKSYFNLFQNGLLSSVEIPDNLVIKTGAWQEWLESIELIRESAGWRSIGGKNPFTEYVIEVQQKFSIMNEKLLSRIIYSITQAFLL